MTSRTRLAVLIVSTPLVAFAVIGGLLGKAFAREDTYQHLRVFEDVVSLILNNYVEQVDVDDVMGGAMRGLAEGLDADSAWLTRQEVELVERGAPLPEGDTGLELTRQYYIRVIAARDGSPAARAGLRTGDFVRAIDNKPTRDMSVFEAMRLLRGPSGSTVKLTVIRGSAAEPHVVDLVRERNADVPVSGRALGHGVGYVRIAAFSSETPGQVRKAIADLQRAGVEKLAIDLRSTAQGTLDAGLATARLFVPSGTLAQREARGQAAEPIVAAKGDGAITMPVAVLTTNGTSGAAELFAAALVGNKRAESVGERTLGRAALQKLVKLPDGTGLWLTWSRYMTPAGKAILGAGVEPTVAVEEPDVEFGAEPPAADPILDKAVERLGGIKAAA